MRKLVIVLIVVVLGWLGWRWWHRHHESGAADGRRAWATSWRALPADLMFVANADVHRLEPALRLALREADGELVDIAATVKDIDRACKVDTLRAIDSMVVASEKYGYVVVLALADSATRETFDDCMGEVAKAHGRKVLIEDRDGATFYEGVTRETWALRWLDDQAFIAGLGDEGFADPAYLKRMSAGGIAKDETFGKLAATVAPDAAFSLLVRNADLGEGGHPGVASVAQRGKDIVFEGRLYPDNRDKIEDVASEAQQLIDWGQILVGDSGELARFAPLVHSAHVEREDDHVAVHAKAAVLDLLKPAR